MAKQQANTPASETPFQRFEWLAQRLVAVPKAQVHQQERGGDDL
jgi:hypothetical protein